jgi:hypothetical protein
MLWNGFRGPSARGPKLDLDAICSSWGVDDLKLFKRSTNPGEPLQLLVTFAPGAPTALRAWRALRDELTAFCGRPVELMMA